jgi:hypothetical protein
MVLQLPALDFCNSTVSLLVCELWLALPLCLVTERSAIAMFRNYLKA